MKHPVGVRWRTMEPPSRNLNWLEVKAHRASHSILRRSGECLLSTQSCLKRFADMVSAFENGRAGQDRPQWA